MTAKKLDEPSIIEDVEVLAGKRGKASIRRAAIRIQDLDELLRIEPVKAEQVSGTPTAAQYNKLLEDVTELNNRLNAVALALQRRLIA
ncbi:hypothetical protein [Ciceribacter sp. L1K22]|uniref:hypothetical protein n=1 Tax=Ciceribacter sp. L1K22 TaxID=2820275 RepID=UPI001ABEC015|nr:hypothetical protein [Ciceribacter sp. L1K22]MBO3760349.1 hypothetical protein [Ciceribacter sp. L1K22]